ncbi:hypothetical protein LDENG_00235870 [Lucifuga dentata]|nr:hypothetical protein LDENG_00235870 [Lucifuga dentata]
MLGTLTAVPIKVPQVSSLHRLAGQAATVLPQVRPKTRIPDSLPHGPCQDLQPLSLQRATAVVSPKSQGPALPGPALPAANTTFSSDHQSNGQQNTLPPSPHSLFTGPDSSGPSQHVSAGPGVAYAIIASSPAASSRVSAVSEAVKVIIIQPQTPSSTEPRSHDDLQADLPSSPSLKKDEDPEKIAFMVALGLVTTEHLEEIQMKRQERKRRSTANPAYSGLFEPERKRFASHFLNNSLFLSARDSEEFCWKEDVQHEELCSVCQEKGELQPCHTCPRAYHPTCLHPPLKTPPRGAWFCPKCQKKVLNKENMSWPQNFVQSYVTHKTVRQEEKRRLLRRNGELKEECAHLEEQDEELNKTLQQCLQVRDRLLSQQRDAQASLDRLKTLIRLIQRDHVTQVAATIATVSASPPWIKPTSTSMTDAAPAPPPSHNQTHM